MGKSVRNWLAAGGFLFVSISCLAVPEPEGTGDLRSRITVRVFNHTQASFETWKSAQSVATRIFDHAGIESVWMHCSLSSDGKFLPPECAHPRYPEEIILRLVPVTAMTRTPFGDAALGISAHPEKGTPASASIFYDRVLQLAKGGAAPVTVILGHVAAHEVGHLLLGPKSHAPVGLMYGRWDRPSLRLANDAQLNFLPREAAAIRKEVGVRSGTVTSVSQGFSARGGTDPK